MPKHLNTYILKTATKPMAYFKRKFLKITNS